MRDENVFQLEKRAIFSKVRENIIQLQLLLRLPLSKSGYTIDVAASISYFTFCEAWRLYQWLVQKLEKSGFEFTNTKIIRQLRI